MALRATELRFPSRFFLNKIFLINSHYVQLFFADVSYVAFPLDTHALQRHWKTTSGRELSVILKKYFQVALFPSPAFGGMFCFSFVFESTSMTWWFFFFRLFFVSLALLHLNNEILTLIPVLSGYTHSLLLHYSLTERDVGGDQTGGQRVHSSERWTEVSWPKTWSQWSSMNFTSDFDLLTSLAASLVVCQHWSPAMRRLEHWCSVLVVLSVLGPPQFVTGSLRNILKLTHTHTLQTDFRHGVQHFAGGLLRRSSWRKSQSLNTLEIFFSSISACF